MVKDIEKNIQEKMEKTLSVLKHELSTLKAGRANPSLLDRISVEYYGTPTPLNQLANIAAPEPRVLTISPWDAKS
ncbi:MAG TPA: ribosome recycling factor, partial [Clostridia bacterium]|nr:ribosome recycling factor [Clostridia bacterium]